MKRILIISDSELHKDPRVLIQIKALQEDYKLVCLGRTHPGEHYIGCFYVMGKVDGLRRLFMKQLSSLYKKIGLYKNVPRCKTRFMNAVKQLKHHEFDLILCNDVPSAPLAFMLRSHTGGKIYLDAHEFTPRHWEGKKGFEKKKPYLEFLMQEYVSKVDYGTTVCRSIADFYTNDYGFNIDDVVMNLPEYNDLLPSEVNAEQIKMVHHGVANSVRKLESLVDIVRLLDTRFTLDFYIINNTSSAYLDLVAYAKSEPRVRFCEPVSTGDIPAVLNEYDIGLLTFEPVTVNLEYMLPNKFFEFIQARLALAIWPSVEVLRLLREYDLGISSETFSVAGLSKMLNELTAEDVFRYKNNSHAAAQVLNSSDSIKKISNGVEICLSK